MTDAEKYCRPVDAKLDEQSEYSVQNTVAVYPIQNRHRIKHAYAKWQAECTPHVLDGKAIPTDDIQKWNNTPKFHNCKTIAAAKTSASSSIVVQ